MTAQSVKRPDPESAVAFGAKAKRQDVDDALYVGVDNLSAAYRPVVHAIDYGSMFIHAALNVPGQHRTYRFTNTLRYKRLTSAGDCSPVKSRNMPIESCAAAGEHIEQPCMTPISRGRLAGLSGSTG